MATSTIKASDLDMQVPGFVSPQDLRFNIKASPFSEADESYLFVDWIKVETVDITPAISISHANISLAVNGVAYINPTFNTGCTNHAFEMVSSDTNVAKVIRYNSTGSAMAENKIKGIASGSATITMTTPGGATGTFTVTVS